MPALHVEWLCLGGKDELEQEICLLVPSSFLHLHQGKAWNIRNNKPFLKKQKKFLWNCVCRSFRKQCQYLKKWTNEKTTTVTSSDILYICIHYFSFNKINESDVMWHHSRQGVSAPGELYVWLITYISSKGSKIGDPTCDHIEIDINVFNLDSRKVSSRRIRNK